jgi:hypothetical protein
MGSEIFLCKEFGFGVDSRFSKFNSFSSSYMWLHCGLCELLFNLVTGSYNCLE